MSGNPCEIPLGDVTAVGANYEAVIIFKNATGRKIATKEIPINAESETSAHETAWMWAENKVMNDYPRGTTYEITIKSK